MDTSGVMVFALRRKAERHLNNQFRLRQVEKKYLALVEGELLESNGVIDAPLRREGGLPPRSVIDHDDGKSSITHYELLLRSSRQSLVGLYPKTGRSHQLRVHMLSLGHPIIGDRIYHSKPDPGQRLMLHAHELSFTHPYSEKRMTFRCEPDPEFNFTPEEFDV
jgi:tRNA pseudouridine32 synthase/23S rRNA pseudouridine746 synthase